MLTVLDNINDTGKTGVKIQLQNPVAPAMNVRILPSILVTAVLIALVGIGFALGLPLGVGCGLIVVIIAGGILWQKFLATPRRLLENATTPHQIAGGEVLITPAQIEHISAANQKQIYPLPQHIRFALTDNQLLITNLDNVPLLTITGFREPQHAKVAQALLEGKAIKTQGKAIRMQAE